MKVALIPYFFVLFFRVCDSTPVKSTRTSLSLRTHFVVLLKRWNSDLRLTSVGHAASLTTSRSEDETVVDGGPTRRSQEERPAALRCSAIGQVP